MPGDGGSGEPETVERGRYRVLALPDGGLLVNRAANLCERCENCGCGEPREPLGPVPGMVLQMMDGLRGGGGGKLPNPAELVKMMGAIRAGRRG